MKEMINKSRHGFAGLSVVGFDMGSAEGDYTGELTLMLNAARNEERGNRAQVFASRLEAIACFIIQKEMTGTEAAEALRQEATRIQNEAGDLH
ncbi:DUF2732 family protein [Rahnella sp. RcJ3]|jgi:hypothetical protein|uniref:DUF2732 family protein n=1 Tax=Rahnella sp. RcJ3 TaxID=2292446 RepID=UPI00351AAFDB